MSIYLNYIYMYICLSKYIIELYTIGIAIYCKAKYFIKENLFDIHFVDSKT